MRIQFIVFFLYIISSSLHGNEKYFNPAIVGETNQHPSYLYKILSLQNWQETQSRKTLILPNADNAFIHFSREDQLERILKKYWSDVPQFVILKIDTNKLEGRLVYETNEGGSNKYYHLYEGFMPFSSIVESKVVYR